MAIIPREEVTNLLIQLQHCKAKTNEEWLASLNSRKREELVFHDHDRSPGASAPAGKGMNAANRKYYATNDASRNFLLDWIRSKAPGTVFLDYACGDGGMAIEAARAGAALAVGLDISQVSIGRAEQAAAENGVLGNTFFLQGDCEDTGLPSGCIDTILCSGMLHHLDLSYAFPELRRILKPGGVMLAVEALGYNPLIKLYRALTPSMRTDWERRHILTLEDVRFARRFFGIRDVRYWHFFSIMVTPLRRTSLFPSTLRLANALDRLLLGFMPFSLLAWMITFECVKPNHD